MDRWTADLLVGATAVLVAFGGGLLTGQAYEQRQSATSMMGGMMGGSTGTMHGPDPIVYAVGTLLAVGVVGGAYLAVRESITATTPRRDAVRGTWESDGGTDVGPASWRGGAPEPTPDAESTGGTPSGDDDPSNEDADERPPDRVLDVLPDDERRVLEPVLDSPGITQIALRDRSDFSKSKVSQTVSDLEKRGLLYREKQGRTYRIYPADDLANGTENAPDA
jgi:DNA-binding transcriptional ArsR family regulator